MNCGKQIKITYEGQGWKEKAAGAIYNPKCDHKNLSDVILDYYNPLSIPAITFFGEAGCQGNTYTAETINAGTSEELKLSTLVMDQVGSVMMPY